jgi:Domain of unknown function (DUF4136)
MKRLIVCAGLCVAFVAVAAAQTPKSKYGVTVKAEKNVDFAKFTTYSWSPGRPSTDKTIDAQIISAIDRELAALGVTKATSGPGDIVATYYSTSRTDVDVKGKPSSTGARPQYSVGTLVVALLEPESRRRLLELRADRPIDAEPSKLEATIDEAVAALFAQYPTRTRK